MYITVTTIYEHVILLVVAAGGDVDIDDDVVDDDVVDDDDDDDDGGLHDTTLPFSPSVIGSRRSERPSMRSRTWSQNWKKPGKRC